MSGSVAMARFRMTFVFGVDLGRFANDRHSESEGLSTRPSLLNHRITREIASLMKRLSLVVLRRQRELPRCARVAPRVAQGSVHAKLNSLILSVRKRVALPERLHLLPMTVGSERKTQIERALNFLNLPDSRRKRVVTDPPPRPSPRHRVVSLRVCATHAMYA